jgi:chorismate mutase/prephenate dehydratase
MSSLSVATKTASTPGTALAIPQTLEIRLLPATIAKGLPGKRDEANRAGITIMESIHEVVYHRLIMEKKVAFQGILGSFGSMSARALFGTDITSLYCDKFRKVFDAVASGDATYGVIPLENALAGSLQENTDLLREYSCWICAEYYCPVTLNLLGKGTRDEVRLVFSHPKAFEQCSKFLQANPQIQAVVWSDTARAAQHVANQDDPSLAAIASDQAGAVYGLPILERCIQNHKLNATRFIAISAKPIDCPNATKCSMVVMLAHQPGSLATFLTELAALGLNVTKIESRPIVGKPFETSFHIDLEKTASSRIHLAQIASELKGKTQDIRILGLYMAQQIPAPQ